MLGKEKIDIALDLLMSIVLVGCLVRFGLVMTAGISILGLTYVIFAGALAVVYFLLTRSKYRNHYFGTNFLFIICCAFSVALACLFTTNQEYGNTAVAYFKQLIILLLIWGIYVFLIQSDQKVVRAFVAVYLLCISASAVYTAFVAFTGEEDVIRATAFGEYDVRFPFTYGGFDFIYGLVLIYTALLTALKKMWRRLKFLVRVLLLAMEVLFALTIIVSGFSTAFVLILIFTVWQLIPRTSLKIVSLLLILLMLYAFPEVITNAINGIPFIPELTSSRLNELILSLSGQGSSGYITDDGQRLDRIIWSLEVFLEHPLFGGFIGNTKLPFGYHTEWIDQLARYGIFTTLFNAAFWVFTYVKIKKVALESNDNATYGCIRNTFFMFAILGFLNPISMLVTACPLFVLAPFISNSLKKEHELI